MSPITVAHDLLRYPTALVRPAHAEHYTDTNTCRLSIVPGILLAVVQDLRGGLEYVALGFDFYGLYRQLRYEAVGFHELTRGDN